MIKTKSHVVQGGLNKGLLHRALTQMLPGIAKRTKGRVLAVAMLLIDHANTHDRRCFPSVQTLAEESGLDNKTVRRGIADLRGLGFITTAGHVKRGDGTYSTNHYTFADWALLGQSRPADQAAEVNEQVGAESDGVGEMIQDEEPGCIMDDAPVECDSDVTAMASAIQIEREPTDAAAADPGPGEIADVDDEPVPPTGGLASGLAGGEVPAPAKKWQGVGSGPPPARDDEANRRSLERLRAMMTQEPTTPEVSIPEPANTSAPASAAIADRVPTLSIRVRGAVDNTRLVEALDRYTANLPKLNRKQGASRSGKAYTRQVFSPEARGELLYPDLEIIYDELESFPDKLDALQCDRVFQQPVGSDDKQQLMAQSKLMEVCEWYMRALAGHGNDSC